MEKKKLSRRHWLFIIAIVAIFVLYGVFWGEGNFQTVPNQWTKKIMDLPEYSTTDLNGDHYEKADIYQNQLTYLYIWSCEAEAENLQEINGIVAGLYEDGVEFLGCIADEGAALEVAKEIAGSYDLNFPQLLPDETLREELLTKVTAYPTAFLINSEGDIIGGAVVGAMSGAEVEAIIDTALTALAAEETGRE